MSKQEREKKSHFYTLGLSDAMNDEIMEAKEQAVGYSAMRPSQFIRYLINLGLMEYRHMQHIEVCREKARAVGGDMVKPPKKPAEPYRCGIEAEFTAVIKA